jgi:hypothetical protein
LCRCVLQSFTTGWLPDENRCSNGILTIPNWKGHIPDHAYTNSLPKETTQKLACAISCHLPNRRCFPAWQNVRLFQALRLQRIPTFRLLI